MLLEALRSWGALDKDYRLRDSDRDERQVAAMRQRSGRRPRRRAGAGRADRPAATSCKSRLWRGLHAVRALRVPDHDVPAGRRHGHDRRGLRARGRRPDPLQRQGHARSQQDDTRRHRRPTRTRDSGGDARRRERRLVRLHHPAVDPEPDRDQRRRADEGRDRRGALRVRRSRSACSSSAASGRRTSRSTAASPTPTCRSARSPIPAPDFNTTGKGVLLGAYTFGGPNSYEFTAMPPAGAHRSARSTTARRSIRNTRGVRERHLGRLASRRPSRWAAPATGPTQRASSTTTISARSTAASCWPASTPRTCRPGRKARSCRRSMRSRGCTSACCRDESEHLPILAASCAGGRWPSLVLAYGHSAVDAQPADRFTEQTGEALYANVCQACHMIRGRAPSAPAAIRRWRRTRIWKPAAIPSPSCCTGRRPCRRSAR